MTTTSAVSLIAPVLVGNDVGVPSRRIPSLRRLRMTCGERAAIRELRVVPEPVRLRLREADRREPRMAAPHGIDERQVSRRVVGEEGERGEREVRELVRTAAVEN